jgi:hypothetical protein
MIVLAPISVGELIDKITILELKLEYINIEHKRINVLTEHIQLTSILDNIDIPDISSLRKDLYNVNQELWHIENYKRLMERENTFGDDFINAARQVYIKNDIRARIKRDINELVGSTIIEEKSYS